MSEAYKAAMEKSRLAIQAFSKVQSDYRSRIIGDADYFAGRKLYEAAMTEFDKAEALENQSHS